MAGKENGSPNFDKGEKKCSIFFCLYYSLTACINTCVRTLKNVAESKFDLSLFILEGLIQAAIGKKREIQLVKGIKLELKGGDKIDSRILVSNGI